MSDLHEVHNFLHVLSYPTNVRLLEELSTVNKHSVKVKLDTVYFIHGISKHNFCM